MTRLTAALKNLGSMTFNMYLSTILHISINATEPQLFYYILDSIFHLNFISTALLFVSFFYFSIVKKVSFHPQFLLVVM